MSFECARFEGARIDGDKLILDYSLDELRFRRTVGIGGCDASFADREEDLRSSFGLLGVFGLEFIFLHFDVERFDTGEFLLDTDDIETIRRLFLQYYAEHLYLQKRNPDLCLISNGASRPSSSQTGLKDRALWSFTGGKDSIVTGSLLDQLGVEKIAYTHALKPAAITLKTAQRALRQMAEVRHVVTVVEKEEFCLPKEDSYSLVRRDGRILRQWLAKNGHRLHKSRRPAWGLTYHGLMPLVAELEGCRYIVVSNERSANEASLTTADGRVVNHQFGKSFPAEAAIRNLYRKYCSPQLQYFSMLMPLYDIQITMLFAEIPRLHSAFHSCNREVYWCGKCGKCAFVFLAMSAFLEPRRVEDIFGSNYFKERRLRGEFLGLCGIKGNKPLECVGTTEECQIAAWLAGRAYRKPVGILKRVARSLPPDADMSVKTRRLFSSFCEEHHLPDSWARQVKESVSRQAALLNY